MTGLLLLLLLADVVETPHYELHAPADVVQEYARILEAAYPQFERFFKKKLKVKKGEKLVLHFGEAAPDSDEAMSLSANKTYAPSSGIAYAPKGHSSYTSRVQLLRAAATQFHWRAAMRNARPAARWWEIGIPEYLAQHHWDGSVLKLGVKPLIGYAGDHPSTALGLKEQFEVFRFVDDRVPIPSLSWAYCRFMLTGIQGKPFSGYDKWARKMNGGNTPLKLFKRSFGTNKAWLRTKFGSWLDSQQPQLEQVAGDWSAIGPDRVQGIARKHGILRVRGAPTAVEATIVVPKKGTRWIAGALVHYNNKDDYTVALLDWGGFIRIQRWMKTRWQMIERGQGPPKGKDGNYKLQIFRRKGKTYLMVGMDGYGPWDVPGDGIGLAIDRCDVRFKAISWK